jgi:hypothetical protein
VIGGSAIGRICGASSPSRARHDAQYRAYGATGARRQIDRGSTVGDVMTSWRDSITVHPLADSFPMMSDGELQELAADIK